MYNIVFSATGRSEKVADAFCSAFDNVEKIDLSLADFSDITLAEDDFCFVTAPVYGGVIPQVAADNIMKIKANGAKAVVMAVYGNRAYDDALAQLKDVCTKSGFTVCGAVGAVAQHSLLPAVAADRPDENDKKQLAEFACRVMDKIKRGNMADFTVPGKVPGGEAHSLPVHPKATKACVKCGLCAEKCPVVAISKENPMVTDKTKCITCMRCVEICPQNARQLMPAVIKMANPLMKKVWGAHREIEFYL